MIFDRNGLPIEDNASDKQDSARLAGICVTFGFASYLDLTLYMKPIFDGITFKTFQYIRHPDEYIYDLSRDQGICLISGFGKNKQYDCVSLSYVNGKDIMSPTVTGHEARCKGKSASLWQDCWLVADILFKAIFDPKGEPNQLMCMVEIAGPNWKRFYKLTNFLWKSALRKYWIETRAKPEIELCEHMIKSF